MCIYKKLPVLMEDFLQNVSICGYLLGYCPVNIWILFSMFQHCHSVVLLTFVGSVTSGLLWSALYTSQLIMADVRGREVDFAHANACNKTKRNILIQWEEKCVPIILSLLMYLRPNIISSLFWCIGFLPVMLTARAKGTLASPTALRRAL